MTELLTAQQMRDLESSAIQSGTVSGLELMERAGQGVVEAMIDTWPQLFAKPRHASVLCGPGNNGGDGFVIARMLKRLGWDVRVHLFGDPAKLPPDAQRNYDLWVNTQDVLSLTPRDVFAGPRPDIIIDAVFGIGLTRPLPEAVAEALDPRGRKVWKRSHSIKVVAVDCPSGLDLDRGTVFFDEKLTDESEVGPWPKTINMADLTVTFQTPKLGHYLGLGPGLCRRLKVVDIGLSGFLASRSMLGLPPDREVVRLVDPTAGDFPLRPSIWPLSHMSKPSPGGHKYEHGHVMVFAGDVGRGGAARLAARAALRCGAGLVTVICSPAALSENASQLTAIMLKPAEDDVSLMDVADHRVSGFVLGPGMGLGPVTRKRVIEVLGRRAQGSAWRDPVVVLDADALSSFSDAPETLFAHTHPHTVLTPHEGEFARLFPDIDQDRRTRISKVEAVRRAAERAGCIVLLKGPDTVIAEPGGGASIHASVYGREVSWLATAGAGDVLAGLIAGLAAPGTSSDLFVMTEIAAYLHVEAARAFGPGLIAEDIPEQLPALLSRLERG